MNKPVKETVAALVKDAAPISGLALLREPFLSAHISKLPKPTRRQTEEVKADFKAGIRCEVCGGWHHPKVVHLDYVGHAALTNRLLDCDPKWNWEPVAMKEDGTPSIDGHGGMWIELTVCGVTRLGYGNADGKKGGDAVKELIGDALRNAAMRFGAALDLWHKGDLHGLDDPNDVTPPASTVSSEQYVALRNKAQEAGVAEEKLFDLGKCKDLQQFPAASFDAAMRKLDATIAANASKPSADIRTDEIPY